MTTASMLSSALIAALAFSASAIADPQMTGKSTQADMDQAVLVIRGTEQQGSRPKSPAPRRPSATRTNSESGVIVDRPDPAGFLRETNRLAAQAEAREQRAAEDEYRTRSERYIPVYYPTPKPPGPPPK